MPLSRPAHWRAPALAAAAALVLTGTAACAPRMSIEDADVPAWQATALPTPLAGGSGPVHEQAGRLEDDSPVPSTLAVPGGTYSLTLVCEGGGKAFLSVRSAGTELLDLGAACYGSRETARLEVPGGPLELSMSSVDAPVLYAYRLVPAAG